MCAQGAFAASLGQVKLNLADFPDIAFRPGWIPLTFHELPEHQYRIVHMAAADTRDQNAVTAAPTEVLDSRIVITPESVAITSPSEILTLLKPGRITYHFLRQAPRKNPSLGGVFFMLPCACFKCRLVTSVTTFSRHVLPCRGISTCAAIPNYAAGVQ
jgi:hypothetical protein